MSRLNLLHPRNINNNNILSIILFRIDNHKNKNFPSLLASLWSLMWMYVFILHISLPIYIFIYIRFLCLHCLMKFSFEWQIEKIIIDVKLYFWFIFTFILWFSLRHFDSLICFTFLMKIFNFVNLLFLYYLKLNKFNFLWLIFSSESIKKSQFLFHFLIAVCNIS